MDIKCVILYHLIGSMGRFRELGPSETVCLFVPAHATRCVFFFAYHVVAVDGTPWAVNS